jgi:beta-N-acetylhexosaminidase
VARLNSTNGFGPSFSAAILGYFNEEDTTRRGTAMMADWLSDMGFNVNFAPVVDLEINTGGVIGGLDRSFSRDPQIVTNHAYWFIDEFHKKNIATCLKHFPGHGSAENDSHLGFTDITDTWLHEELEPYENLLDSGSVDMIMTGHLYHAGMDSLHPATLSYNVITDSLRNRLGYDGVVVTDEIFMNAISDNYGFVEASILAINAGVDIILSSPSVLPNDTIHHRRIADVFIDSMEQAVLTGIIPESRIEESYRRIMDLKYRWGLMDIEEEHIVDIPLHFTLEQNYPNPFNPATTIEYNVAEASLIRVDIYNALGEHVETMVNKEHSPGKYQISWNAGSYASGLYVYSLTAVTPAKGTITKLSKKMLLVK